MKLDSSSETQSGLLAWFSKPWVGITGTIASILGVILAVYFYSISEKKRLLIVANDPPFSIVKAGQTGSIDIVYRGKPITTDVYVCRMYIWNGGGETIHRDNILEPVRIQLNPNAPILDATIRKVSRPAANIALDMSQLEQGAFSVSWKLLEHNDGAVVDVIYASKQESNLQVSGVIEEQPQIRTRAYRTSTQAFNKRKPSLLVVFAAICLCLILVLSTRLYGSFYSTKPTKVLLIVLSAFSVAMFIFALANVVRVDTTPPVF